MIDPRKPNYLSTPVSPDRARFRYAPRPVPPGPASRLAAPPRTPAVAVITPFYNTGPVFHETAACVLGQSLQDFEWIIINDRSTDPAALAVLDAYRPGGARNPQADPRIRIIDHAANHGLSAARNTGFRAARAPYVFQLDSDDLIEPTTLEKCALFLEANPDFAFVKGNSVGFEGQTYLWEKGFHDSNRFLDQNLVTATAMIRRRVHEAVGGFDETIRAGMEDWEFWLRSASMGHWGATIPEFLDWYRRRPPQQFDAWANLKCEQANKRFKDRMHREHGALFESGGFPAPARPWHMPYQELWEGPSFANPLDNTEGVRRLLMILPWFRMGGADRFNLDLLRYLTTAAERGWEVTIAATVASGVSATSGNGHPWLAEFSRFTPDIFMLPHLGSPPQCPAMLRYLIQSRRPDVVMVTNSEIGYASLPYLRAYCPDPVFVDFNHMEEPNWKNGGHPRHGAGSQGWLDLNITVSDHLKRWMCKPPREADERRIEVCHINADTRRWKPDEKSRRAVRRALKISDNATVILYAARLCPQKQPLVFAESIARLRDLVAQSRAEVHVLIAGDGELEEPLRRALVEARLIEADTGETEAPTASSPGVFGVHMLGSVSTDRMPALMAASDIFFLPSEWEGIALSIYEAMAAGLAVVGALVGGQGELVTAETGILLRRPKDDPAAEAEAYARTLAELIADPARRSALGAAARTRIERCFELSNMGRRMLALFDKAAEFKRTRPRAAIDRHLARELTQQSIESLRAQELADTLWQYRTWFYDQQSPNAPATAATEQEAARALAYIESSATFRLLSACKRLPPYRLYARARFGADWERGWLAEPGEPAAARLERLRASRSYRAIMKMKKLPPVTVVSRLRHGKAYRESIPERLRED